MADNLESLKLPAELLGRKDRNHEQQPEVIASIHGGGNRVYVHLFPESEAITFKRDLVSINFHTKSGIPDNPLQRVRKPVRDKETKLWIDAELFKTSHGTSRNLRFQIASYKHLILLKIRLGRIIRRILEASFLPFKDLLSEVCGTETT